MRRAALVLLSAFGGCAAESAPPADMVVAVDKLPATVLKAVKQKSPGVKFDTAWKLPSGDYEVSGTTKQGKIRNFLVTAAGEVKLLD